MKALQVLGKKGVEKVHEATLRILSETGIILTYLEAKSLLLDHGAKEAGNKILIPQDVVENCLAKCPSIVKLQGREKIVEIGDGSLYVHNVGGCHSIYELATKENRTANRKDVAATAKLLDALENVSCITPLFTPHDVPFTSMALWMYYDTVCNTTKPIRGPGIHSALEVKALAEISAIACSNLTADISPLSPLKFPDDVAAAILEAARLGIPLSPLPCPIAGVTAPVTRAGGLAQQNAEVLASIVLAQLAHPGLPVIYQGRLSVMDLRTASSVWGNPDIGLISAATIEIGHHYKLPVNVYGFCTNSHSPDVQSGYERAINATLPILAGVDEMSGVGEMEGGKISSLAQIVIDNEILASMKHIKHGIEVNENTLAVDVVAEVMKEDSNYACQRHTVDYMRKGELLIPKLAKRDTYGEWAKQGKKGLAENAESKALDIIGSHEVKPLSEKQKDAIIKVIKAAEKTEGC